jgi:hypothetical protein
MKVARNTTHGLRHDRIKYTSESGAISLSISANRNGLDIEVTVDGITDIDTVSPRWLAAVLINKIGNDPH